MGRRRILWGAELLIILATVLWDTVRRVVLAVLLRIILWTGTRRLLTIPFERRSGEALLRWWGILARVTLLLVLWGVDQGYICLLSPPSPHPVDEKEDPSHEKEGGHCDNNARGKAQSVPANEIAEADGGKSVEARLRGVWGRSI